jgi:predicted Zn-dependent protease
MISAKRLFMSVQKRCVCFLVIAFLVFQTAVPAGATFTLDDENKIGKEFYEKLSKHNLLIQDEKVNDYITRLGNMILSRSSNVLFHFHFSVIRSSAINAFATPGGYVYVNRGLINLCENESELAGVLAHEIAHVNSRHIAQQIEKSQKINMASLAAVLAGVFLGGGGVGTEAAVGLTMATSTALSLKYSRENEEEADRLGMAYLVSSGYDGKGMMTFLKTMKNYEFYSNSIPSYFMTHPGTDERIGYIDSLLQSRYKGAGSLSILGGLQRTQTLLMLGDSNPDHALKYFQNRRNKNPDDADALYGLAATQAKLGQTAESFTNFAKALSLSPDDVDILRDVGISYFNAGQTADALTFLRRAYSLDEKDDGTLLYIGRAYEQAGNFGMALDFYRKYQGKNPADVNILYNIAMAYGKNGNQGESHYYFALFFKKKNKLESALFHFKEAQKTAPTGSERDKDIQREMEALSKRNTSPKDFQSEGRRRREF